MSSTLDRLSRSREHSHFVAREHTPRALRQHAQREWTNRHTHESKHLDAKLREHTPDVAVLAFIQHDLEPDTAARSGAQQRYALHLQRLAGISLDDSSFHTRDGCFVQHTSHLHVVHFVDMRTG